MTTVIQSNRRHHIALPPTPRPKPPRWRWGLVVLLALATGLVFCHGCHRGDHDDEPAWIWFRDRK